MAKSWATFEERVRALATYIWGHECKPAHIGGVDVDGAIELEADMRVLIEITEEKNLQKIRNDIIKLNTAKAALMQQTGAFARCYCVISGVVTNAMLEAAEPHRIKVLSVDSFSKIFFDFENYRIAREKSAFGSAVNPLTGKRDDSAYVPVKYIVSETSKEVTIQDIAKFLHQGKRIVLTGEYGSGKSRCMSEVFRAMATKSVNEQDYPIAIDLRDSWGLKRGPEIISRHLTDLGVETLQSAAMRALASDCATLLLDGFDELGSQAWSNDSAKLRVIRGRSLDGVRDLISRTSSGVLISGREHYFNSNTEMFSGLGLDPKTTLLLRCKTEFTEEETQEFFKRIEAEIVVPTWLPRRPLICQTIADLSDDELDEMFGLAVC